MRGKILGSENIGKDLVTVLFLLFMLMVFVFFPYLLIPLIIFLGIGFLFLIPYVLMFNSFYNIITIPGQIIKIAMDRRVRKNHSLEHATINVLEQRYGRTLRVGGLAYSNGFSLSGPDLPSYYEVLDAVREGHSRMTSGERNLAIHPRCGTSMAAANLLFSIVFIIVLIYAKRMSVLYIIPAFLLANILSKPFGRILQKFFTTYQDVSDVYILDIYEKPSSASIPFVIIPNPNRTYFIRTEVGERNTWYY